MRQRSGRPFGDHTSDRRDRSRREVRVSPDARGRRTVDDGAVRIGTASGHDWSTRAAWRLRSWWMGADSPLVALTDRELATLALIADGLSNEAVADRLH